MPKLKYLDSNDNAVEEKPSGFKLSRRYGENPANVTCFFCGENNGIILLGELPNDRKAPDQLLVDYIPCSQCKKSMGDGVTLMGVQPSPAFPGQMSNDPSAPLYPTGRWTTISAEQANKIIKADYPLTRGQIIMVPDDQLPKTE